MATLQGSSADISHPRRSNNLSHAELAVLSAMYFTGLLNHRVHDLAARSQDGSQTQAVLDVLEMRGYVWLDRLQVYHLTEDGAQEVLALPDDELEELLGATMVFDALTGAASGARPIHPRGCVLISLLAALWLSGSLGVMTLLSVVIGQPGDALRLGYFIIGAAVNVILLAVLIVYASAGGSAPDSPSDLPPEGSDRNPDER